MAHIEFLNDDKKGDDCLANVIKYVFGNNGRHFTYYGGCAVDPDNAIYQMQTVKEHFGKTDGRQALHIVVSFDNRYNIADYEAYVIAPVIASFFSRRFQVVYAVHDDTDNVHIHFGINSVSYIDGSKYTDKYSERTEFIFHVRNVEKLLCYKGFEYFLR